MPNQKKIRRALRRPLETVVFWITKLWVPLLPRRGIVALANTLARIGIAVPNREKTIGLKNLDAVFGDSKSPTEKQQILATSFATFAQTMLDVFWFSQSSKKRILKYVELEDGSDKGPFFEERPVICITAHMGSWEVMGQTAALLGADLASIAATIKNPTVDRILIKQRERTGQIIIPQKGALKSLIARFRRNGKAAFVLDQQTSKQEGGIVADFLGLPMPVSPAPAALAYRTGTVIMLVFCLPKAGGYYHIHVSQVIEPPPFSKDKDTDEIVQTLSQQIMDGISAEIRKHPQFWLWSYKHWRRNGECTYPDNYPTY